jgi:hypothetical protein
VLQHEASHDGSYFLLGEKEDLLSEFPEGVDKALMLEFELTGSSALMVRRQGRELVESLDALANASEKDRQRRNRALEMWERREERVAFLKAEKAAADAAAASGESGVLPAFTASDLPFRLLTGPRGIGKSAVMLYALAHARRTGWLTVFVPSMFRIMRQGEVLRASRTQEGFLDQPDLALEMLQHLLRNHADLLADVPQRGTYPRDRFLSAEDDALVSKEKADLRVKERHEKAGLKASAESTGKQWDPSSYSSRIPELIAADSVDRPALGATLADMVAWGVANPPHATECMVATLTELRQCTEHPVFIAIDGFNWAYEKTEYWWDSKVVPPQRVSLAAPLRFLTPGGFSEEHLLERGFVLTADTFTHSFSASMYDEVRFPQYTHVEIEPLSRDAIHSQLLHYHFSGNYPEVASRLSVDSHAVDFYRTMSAGNPAEVARAAMLVF